METKTKQTLGQQIAEKLREQFQIARWGQPYDVETDTKRLREALEFYANPETYHAVVCMCDPPTGGWETDFDKDHGHPHYNRPMPGKRARSALDTAMEGEK